MKRNVLTVLLVSLGVTVGFIGGKTSSKTSEPAPAEQVFVIEETPQIEEEEITSFSFTITPREEVVSKVEVNDTFEDEDIEEDIPADEDIKLYMANTNTHKFHTIDCSDIDKMNEENKEVMAATYEEMIAQGYSPCGHCNPF